MALCWAPLRHTRHKEHNNNNRHVAVSEVHPWSAGQSRNIMKLRHSIIDTEADGKLDWASNSAQQFTVVNLDERMRTVSIAATASCPTQAPSTSNSSNLVDATYWAKQDLFEIRHHDTEPPSSHPCQSQDIAHPPINFDDFFNSESLVQEDIVVWFNLGMHHLPHSGDLPNTVFTTAHSGLQIMPLNYLNGSPSRGSVNMVRVQYGSGNKSQVFEFGQGSPMCSVDVESSMPDLENYVGDEVMRKFLYDQNSP